MRWGWWWGCSDLCHSSFIHETSLRCSDLCRVGVYGLLFRVKDGGECCDWVRGAGKVPYKE